MLVRDPGLLAQFEPPAHRHITRGIRHFRRPRFVDRGRLGQTRPPTEPVDDASSGDHRHEGDLLSHPRIKSVSRPPQIDEYLLHGILGILEARQPPPRERPHQPTISGDAFLHSRLVSAGDPR